MSQFEAESEANENKHDFTILSSHAYDFSDEEEVHSHRSLLKNGSNPENGNDIAPHLVEFDNFMS